MNELQIFNSNEFGSAIIHGYDNLYCVEPNGRIISPSYTDKSGKIRKAKILSQVTRGKGYKCVGLMKNGKQVHVSVHRLVAEAFIPNPENKPQVNHIDGNKINNDVSNLEWVTNQENVLHAFKTNLRKPTCKEGEKNSKSKLKNEDICYIRSSKESAKILADRFNVTASAIYKIKGKVRWRHI